MNFVEVTKKNADGELVTKKVEKRLAPYYKSAGWTIKEQTAKKIEKYKSTINLEK